MTGVLKLFFFKDFFSPTEHDLYPVQSLNIFYNYNADTTIVLITYFKNVQYLWVCPYVYHYFAIFTMTE